MKVAELADSPPRRLSDACIYFLRHQFTSTSRALYVRFQVHTECNVHVCQELQMCTKMKHIKNCSKIEAISDEFFI